MQDSSAGASNGAEPDVYALATPPPPAPPTAAQLASGPRMAPKKRIYVYDSIEWEVFVLEWVDTLSDYVEVVGMGGANDRGVDIGAFVTEDHFRGDWDCYQCKHYDHALAPSDIWPEVFKLFLQVSEDSFVMPSRYFIVAPRECGPTLTRYLADTKEMKAKFLDELQPSGSLGKSNDYADVEAVMQIAKKQDFRIFKWVALDTILQQHEKTPFYLTRFGGTLPPRPSVALPPDHPAAHETCYVEKLLDVYNEQIGGVVLKSCVDALAHAQYGNHLRRQREAFFSAESLRLFARDSVPEGTYELLQRDMLDSVVERYERAHSDGMTRLSEVLDAAISAQITSNALISVLEARDRKGICHQLANDNNLTWVQ